jgi:hypothetical protein
VSGDRGIARGSNPELRIEKSSGLDVLKIIRKVSRRRTLATRQIATNHDDAELPTRRNATNHDDVEKTETEKTDL